MSTGLDKRSTNNLRLPKLVRRARTTATTVAISTVTKTNMQ
jgi:hypothetical protein